MTLLLDAGNTRLKWARLADGRLGPVHATPHRDVPAADWQAQLRAAGRPARLVVANVAGEAFGHALAEWSRATWDLAPEFVATRARAAGLAIAYAMPAALGVDRWLAMIAAWKSARRACVVVVAGTASTVDAVDGQGRHRGGYIVPGVRMMREALHERTGGIARAAALAPPAVDGAFGVNTGGAVEQGARVALAALAERSVAELARVLVPGAAPPRLFLAGGDAELVAPLLRVEHARAPDLVLQGLAAVAQEAPP